MWRRPLGERGTRTNHLNQRHTGQSAAAVANRLRSFPSLPPPFPTTHFSFSRCSLHWITSAGLRILIVYYFWVLLFVYLRTAVDLVTQLLMHIIAFLISRGRKLPSLCIIWYFWRNSAISVCAAGWYGGIFVAVSQFLFLPFYNQYDC